jgi:hypothetical protein
VKRIFNLKRSLFFLSALAFGVLVFQNCAQPTSSSFEDKALASTMSLLEYRYKSATPIYFELQMIKTAADATDKVYEMVAVAAPSDGSAKAISYVLAVYGMDNTPLCTTKTGVLAAGTSMVRYNCLMKTSDEIQYTTMKVKFADGEWNVYKRYYNN